MQSKKREASELPKEKGASERPKEEGGVAPKVQQLTVMRRMKRKEGIGSSELIYINGRIGSTEEGE